eukprot:gene4859-5497_t
MSAKQPREEGDEIKLSGSMAGKFFDFLFHVQQDIFSLANIDQTTARNVIIPICLLASVYWIFIHPYLIFKRYGIPTATPIVPPLGNLLELVKGSIKMHQRCIKKYGKIYGIFIGRRPSVIISDSKMLEQLFVKAFGNFHDRPSFLGKQRSPMHLGMVIVQYSDWRRIRLTVNPTFTAGKIKQMMPLMKESMETLVSIMGEKSKKNESIDMSKLYGSLTMEVILCIAFGLKSDFQTKRNERLLQEALKWFSVDRRVLFVDMLPLPLLIKHHLKELFSPDPAYLVNIIKPVVEERKKAPSARKDFLQLLLTENKDGGKLKLSDDEIYAQVITFLLAGYETTSAMLSFTTYLLALHPKVQQRLYEEVAEKFDKDDDYSSVYEDIQKLEYMDQVVNESLRMYPPAYQTARIVENECEIGGYHIPKGIVASVPIYCIHHSEDNWKDHDKFDPERFNSENKAKINPLHFLPFGYGPRNCVGMRFALVEAKLALASMLKKFKFVKTPDTEVPLTLTYGITMFPTNGIKVGILPRH